MRWYAMVPIWTVWWRCIDRHNMWSLRTWWSMAIAYAHANMNYNYFNDETETSAAYNDSQYPKEF